MTVGMIDKEELQKILQIGEVDVGNDTLFSRREKLAISKTHLTLVVSSGGSGASAIKEAIRTANQKLESDYSVYMKFIMVESASNEIEATGREMGRQQLQILNISSAGAEERMRWENRADFYKKFVPRAYDVTKLDSNGSGRDRMTGKIKFYDNAEGSYNDVRFRNMIEDLYKNDWNALKNLPVDIMILAGLSGGNGSGTFLDLAAHARHACEHAGASTIRLFGYFFLPDTVERFEVGNLENQKMLYINGYSALKELESYMSVSFNPERMEWFDSRDGATKIVCDVNHRLFDYPVLISGGYEESKSMMAESIINLAIESDGSFDHNSFYSNSVTSRSAYLNGSSLLNGGLLKKDAFPEDSHKYAGIGYAYAAIPDKVVTANVVSNVCQKLYLPQPQEDGSNIRFCTEENRMSRFEMETQIRKLFSFDGKRPLSERSLWEEKIEGTLKKASTLTENNAEITRGEIKAGNVSSYEKGFHGEMRITDGTVEMQTHLKNLFGFFKENAEQVLKDYGPRAMEFLYTGRGPDDKDGNPQYYSEISIGAMLDYVKSQFQQIVTKSKERPSNDISDKLVEKLMKKEINNWKTKFHQAVQHEVKQKISGNLISVSGAWEKSVLEPIAEYRAQCARFADSMEMLTNFYRSAGSPLDDKSYASFLNASQGGNCVNLCTSADVYDWVKAQVSRKINSVSLTEVKTTIIDSFKDNPELWISDAEGKTRAEFDKVMSQCCGLGRGAGAGSEISLSATAYFDYVLSQVEPGEVAAKAEEIVKNIVSQLLEKSKPSLKTKGGFCVVNRFLMIPESLRQSPFGAPIEKAFNGALENVGAGEAKVSVSPSVSDVVCYQTSVANGLCDLTDLPKWETYYNDYNDKMYVHLNNGEFGDSHREKIKTDIEEERAIKEGRKATPLLLSKEENVIFGTGLSWVHYPAVALKNLEDNVYEQEFIKTIFDPIVDYALKEKIIQRKMAPGTNQDVYQYVVNVIPDSWEYLDASGYDKKGNDGRFERGEALFGYLKVQNPLSGEEWQKPILLADSGRFSQPYDFSLARQMGAGMTSEVIEDMSKRYMKRMLRKNTYLFLELRKTLCRYCQVVKELETREIDMKYPFMADKFKKYYQFGIIFEQEKKWFVSIGGSRQSRVFCGFTNYEVSKYDAIQERLYKEKWFFLLAFQKFSEMDFNQLDEILEDRLRDMEDEESEKLKQQNNIKLKEMHQKILTDIVSRYPNREIGDTIRKVFKWEKTEAEFYVKSLAAIKECLNDLNDDADAIKMEPQPEREKQQSQESWECPKCGKENGNTANFCPSCGTGKPEEKPEMTGWKCPECGNENGKDARFCIKCGSSHAENRVMAAPHWFCANCGKKNQAEAKFCLACGSKKA